MAEFQIHSFQNYPDIYYGQLLAFMKMEWPFIFSGKDTYLQESYPFEQNPMHFSWVEQDHLICHGEVLEVEIKDRANIYSILGLGNLFTFPPYRSQGWGTKLLANMEAHLLQQSHRPVVLLFCDPSLVSFYKRSNWRSLDREIRKGNPNSWEPLDGVPLILPLQDKYPPIFQGKTGEPLYVKEIW